MKKLVIAVFIVLPFISYSQVSEFGWLSGIWKMKNKDTFEVWKVGGDKKWMEAISYRVKGADTVLMEKITIGREGNNFFYAPDVAGDQPEVLFKITRLDKTGFTAENPQHDFPKIIRYELVSPTSLKAQIEGDGKVIPFYFDKILP